MTDLNKGRGGGEADFNPSCAAVVNNASYVLMGPPIIIVRLAVRQIQRVSFMYLCCEVEQVREETDGDVVRWCLLAPSEDHLFLFVVDVTRIVGTTFTQSLLHNTHKSSTFKSNYYKSQV